VKRLIIAFIIVISCWVGQIQPLHALPQISVDVEPHEITIGDPIELIIRARTEGYKQVVLPSGSNLAPFEVLKIDTLKSADDEVAVKYTITHFEAGKQELKNIPVLFLAETSTDSANVQAGSIIVHSVLQAEDSTANIRDIHPPVKMGWLVSDVLPFVWIALAILVVGALGLYVYRRWFGGAKIVEEAVVFKPPPYETAVRHLEELRIKKLWQQGLLIEYYSELTEIVKRYIGGRFEFDAPEMTTDELMYQKDRWADNEEKFGHVNQIITCADLVKFASYTPERTDHEANMKAGFEYLLATKPQPKPIADYDQPSKINEELSEVQS